ncbi:hypothetical protein ET33_09625 [Paenibacillus tyrfis]|uniref:Extracellular solute-binding protein n=1 Tax=Paenibacillus tyrfis TaxID=1501230 RepID=A0A081P1F1_9BACL|nr:hypothetical protein ET33_09625 [Paenibacillus tyrfis]
MKVDDQYYALPFTVSMASTLMYNKKAFQDAGIAKPPETLEELFDTAKKLTKRENGAISQIGFIPDYPWIDNVFWPIIFDGEMDAVRRPQVVYRGIQSFVGPSDGRFHALHGPDHRAVFLRAEAVHSRHYADRL